MVFDAIGCLDGDNPDATGIDSQVVMKRWRIEVAMYAAEIAEVRSAAG